MGCGGRLGCFFRKINWQAVEAAGSIEWPELPLSGYTCPSLWRVEQVQHTGSSWGAGTTGPNEHLEIYESAAASAKQGDIIAVVKHQQQDFTFLLN